MPAIKAYHRPTSLTDALHLLNRAEVTTVVIGGGVYVLPTLPDTVDEVVDVQAIPDLSHYNQHGTTLSLGAMVSLQTLVDAAQTPFLLRDAARREQPNTLRTMATLGEFIATPDKESELLATLLVFDATVYVRTLQGEQSLPLSDLLADVSAGLGGGIIVAVTVATEGNTASDRVARTPADKPIVAAVARRLPDGELRLALSGVADVPILVDPNNIKAAINPPSDFRGSREYRRQMAATLSRRVLEQI